MRLNSLYITIKTLLYIFLFFKKSLKSIDIFYYSRSDINNEYNSFSVLFLRRLFF